MRRRLQPYWGLLPAGVLALVLLLNQSLGLLHGIVHGPANATGHAAQIAPVASEPARQADSFFIRLFGGHRSHNADSACRLYDQSSHCDAMPGLPLLVLPLVLPPFAFSVLSGLAVARWHALFQARGPPSVR